MTTKHRKNHQGEVEGSKTSRHFGRAVTGVSGNSGVVTQGWLRAFEVSMGDSIEINDALYASLRSQITSLFLAQLS